MKMIDIPQGYLYGFPLEYDKPDDVDFFDWLVSLGVPEAHAEQCIYIRTWNAPVQIPVSNSLRATLSPLNKEDE